jgi:hypothetical protein
MKKRRRNKPDPVKQVLDGLFTEVLQNILGKPKTRPPIIKDAEVISVRNK